MTDTLEVRLRDHYMAKADELRLSPLEFEQLISSDPVATVTVIRATPRHRRPVWLAVAAAIAVAVGVGSVLAVTRWPDPATTVPTSVPNVPSACPKATAASVAASAVEPGVAMLPVATPAGYCVSTFDSDATDAPQRYTVWSSCTACSAPTASVALVRHGDNPGTTETPEPPHEDFTLEGRAVRYLPASTADPMIKIVSRDGLEPGFSFFGWGLDRQTLVDLATSIIRGTDVPTHEGLQLVSDGPLGALWPGLTPVDVTVDIGYESTDGSAQLNYIYQHGDSATANLSSFAWSNPQATFTSVNGHPALVSAIGDHITVIISLDEHTLVSFVSVDKNNPPLSVDQLAAISLSNATRSDPRWKSLHPPG